MPSHFLVQTLEILLQFLQETYNSLNSPLIVENHIEVSVVLYFILEFCLMAQRMAPLFR